MPSPRDYTEKRIAQLEQELNEARAMVKTAQEKLRETDAARNAEVKEVPRMRFNRKLDGLEKQLDLWKAKVVQREVDLREKRRLLQRLDADGCDSAKETARVEPEAPDVKAQEERPPEPSPEPATPVKDEMDESARKALEIAADKVLSSRISALTLADLALILRWYPEFAKAVAHHEGAATARGFLEAAMEQIDAACADWRVRWAQLRRGDEEDAP